MIVLVDCNAFFCSCERLFRPDIWFKPVGVLSNNDGCFISRTRELKALGVKMGQPYFQVKELCEKNDVQVFSANFSLYTNISSRVTGMLKEISNRVEVYSIDEAFIEIDHMETGQLEGWAIELRARIFQEVGVPVSIGIARTKVLAKLANARAKKKIAGKFKGISVLDSEEREEIALKEFPVEDLWGVGRKSSLKLKNAGIHTAWQLKHESNYHKIQKMLTKVGRMIQDELKGLSCFPIELQTSKKKNITSSRSFSKPLTTLDELKEAVADFCSKACQKLRLQKSSCSYVGVHFRTSPFHNGPFVQKEGFIKLESATQDTRKIIHAAWLALEQHFEAGPAYAKAGIGLYDLCDEDQTQLTFFDEGDQACDVLLMKKMDQVNARDGEGTLRSFACGGAKKSWAVRHDKRSPRYLSGWTELPRVI
jgi:DNA polymerase V